MQRPFHIGCELTGLAICYCVDGTPESLRDPVAADVFCQRAEQVTALWKKASAIDETPKETEILLPVLYKRNRTGEHKVEIEGLRVAEEEEITARKRTEVSVSKAAQKADSLGIPHTLFSDFEMDEVKEEIEAEENVDLTLQTIHEKSEIIRSELRDLEKRREMHSTNHELHGRSIGQRMESTMEHLNQLKERLPPDRLQEANSIKESANSLLTKSRKSTRKHRKLLKKEDISGGLVGRWLSVFWPDDNQWWSVFVQSVNTSLSTATLLYETEEAEEIDLQQLVEKGELAWLDFNAANSSIIGSTGFDFHHTRKKKRHYF